MLSIEWQTEFHVLLHRQAGQLHSRLAMFQFQIYISVRIEFYSIWNTTLILVNLYFTQMNMSNVQKCPEKQYMVDSEAQKLEDGVRAEKEKYKDISLLSLQQFKTE